ncbi:MAG TPA: hypothetical protein VGO03_13450 [Acidimicrobiia bacterium]
MKFSLKKLGASAGLLGVIAAPVIGLTASQAGAVPTPTAHHQDLESAGSDTIYWATVAIDNLYNASTNAKTGFNKGADHVGAIPPVVTAPFPTSYSTGSDANCGVTTYNSGNLPPNGSSAGISALTADGSTGCIDYARSSRGTKAGDAANMDFWAFGLDALSVGRFPKNKTQNPLTTYAPPNLTQAQIIQIYTCNPATGLPFISDWKQVNPALAKKAGTFPIQKFSPQTSSGTYSFFNSKILNGATIDAGCNSSHLSTFIEEHDGAEVPIASRPWAIFPMSYAQWHSDSSKKTPDLRGGITEMDINGVVPGPKTINESASRFLGTRYVYNVTRPVEPDYFNVLDLVAADNNGAGFICAGKAKATIKAFGFQALASATTGTTSSGTNITLATQCRVNPVPL